MIPSQQALNLIEEYEGRKHKAYPDPQSGGAPWTIGVGHTGPEVHEGLEWTDEQIDEALRKDAEEAALTVERYVTAPLTQNEFDALVSMAFNLGSKCFKLHDGSHSTMCRLLNEGQKEHAAQEILKWCSPGTSVEAGLKRRRTAEQQLFLA